MSSYGSGYASKSKSKSKRSRGKDGSSGDKYASGSKAGTSADYYNYSYSKDTTTSTGESKAGTGNYRRIACIRYVRPIVESQQPQHQSPPPQFDPCWPPQPCYPYCNPSFCCPAGEGPPPPIMICPNPRSYYRAARGKDSYGDPFRENRTNPRINCGTDPINREYLAEKYKIRSFLEERRPAKRVKRTSVW